MNNQNVKNIIQKIIEKKEFSDLPEEDVLKAFGQFNKEKYTDKEKVKYTRDLLRKVFSAFASKKILNIKDRDFEWVLKKHISTRERFDNYLEIYSRILKGEEKNLSIIDLGSGVNGFSYVFFKKIDYEVNYTGIEAIGQLVNLTNFYFDKNKINGGVFHLSLFNIEEIKNIIEKTKKPRIIFLFKILDSLEMLERDYSKKLLFELSRISDKIAVSFATRSLIKRTKFKANRNWIMSFIQDNFDIIDNFELGGERYVIFSGKKSLGK